MGNVNRTIVGLLAIILTFFLFSCSYKNKAYESSSPSRFRQGAHFALTPQSIESILYYELMSKYPNSNIQPPKSNYNNDQNINKSIYNPSRIQSDGSIFYNNNYVGRVYSDGRIFNVDGQHVGIIGTDGTIYDIYGNYIGNLHK